MSSRLAYPQAPKVPSARSGAVNPPRRTRIGETRLTLHKTGSQTQQQSNCVPQLIDARAAVAPDALALLAGAEAITFGQLNDRANQIANHLLSLGVDPESPTGSEEILGLCLDRSMTGVVCALGILRSGAGYLPLDPGYPVERLAFMLSDAQPRVLITTQEMAAQLPAGPWQVVAIDDDRDLAAIDRQSTQSPKSRISGERLAYVIYTSGSTGRPKGVEITHASLMNLVSWHNREFQVTADDRASLLAGVGFDAAVWETWPALTAGASLHLPDEATRLSPERLRDWLVAEQVTISFLPTALAERVMRLEWPAYTALRTLLTGAETLREFPSDDLPFRVVNNYGPTEHRGSTWLSARETTLISTTAANVTRVYILDENRQPVNTLRTLGIWLMAFESELTAEKFIENPFSADENQPSARLYRTGDLARFLRSGEIAYLGRIDEQIKILGHRIEPNEIVSVLDRHPAVQASRVIAREEACREKHLVAYVVFKPAAEAAASELRSFLEKELPQFMVPAVFVRLEGFPLTQNGKVDRAALPAPTPENTLRDEVFTAARTPVEQRLAAMLSALLGLDQVSVHDNFFMLGGHSLLGTQLISHIRAAFGVELALRKLFEAPTIEQLSLEIEQLVMARVEAMSEEEVRRLLA